MSDATISNNETAARYEAYAGDDLAGVLEYRPLPGNSRAVSLPHTGVEPAYEGQGIASDLVRYALDDLRDRGLGVRPDCPFVAGWIKRHPEYQTMVVPG